MSTPDGVGVPEGQQAHALDEGNAGVGALHHAHGGCARLEDKVHLLGVHVAAALSHAALVRPVYLVRQDVEQHLRHHVMCGLL